MQRKEIEAFKINNIDDFDMSKTDEVIGIMAEGDVEAEEILRDVASENISYIMILDDMNIRGEQVLFAFLHCNQDFETLKDCLLSRDQMMIFRMNEYFNRKGSAQIAIKYGAPLRRGGLIFPPKDL